MLPAIFGVVLIAATAVLGAYAGLSLTGVLVVTLLVAIVGGALARRTVASLGAGVVLLLARPYESGERLRVHLPECGGHVEGVIVRTRLITTTLVTDDGEIIVANRRLLG